MNPESTRVPESSPAFLNGCLVEGDLVQQHAARKIRRRAIFLSVLLQSFALTALVIFPLLSRGERLPVKIFVERPPYRLGSDHPGPRKPAGNDHRSSDPFPYFTSAANPSRPRISGEGDSNREDTTDFAGLGDGPAGLTDGVLFGIVPPRSFPTPPDVSKSAPIRSSLHALPLATSTRPVLLVASNLAIPPWAFNFVAKLELSCKPSLPPTAPFNLSRFFPVIRSFTNPPWTPCASGNTALPSSMAAPLRSTRTSPSSIP